MVRTPIIAALCAVVSAIVGAAFAQSYSVTGGAPRVGPLPVDPGIRSGAAAAGGYLSGISSDELSFAQDSKTLFIAPWSVSGTVPSSSLAGLGPRYNAHICSDCHSYPATGGSSGATNLEATTMPTLNGANNNVVPTGNYYADGLAFIRSNGPVRIAQQPSTQAFLRLYTIQGMSDASSCTLSQSNFNSLLSSSDLTALIPIPLFGIGLVEGTPNINLVSSTTTASAIGLGITYGRFNMSDDGTIARTGWKAAESSVEEFTALAMTHEFGATSMVYPRKGTESPSSCLSLYNIPDDGPNLASVASFLNPGVSLCTVGHTCGRFASNQVLDASFARALTPALPAWGAESTVPSGWSGSGTTAYTTSTVTVTQGSVFNGQTQFNAVGCQACHIVQQQTGNVGRLTGQNNRNYFPYSDYALHTMGVGLSNGMTQGAAGPQDYKTSALWGTGQRLFFLHDGRTQDLEQTILQHCSSSSEAAGVCSNYQALSTSNQQDLINFLRGL